MERTDAARKVRALETLAGNDGSPEAERDAARAKALSLRERHDLSDDDIARSEPFIMFGHDVFFWSREIEPLLEQAGALIEKALARADKAPLPERLETYVKVHHAVKHAAEETGWSRALRLKLKSRRNAVIREAYARKLEETVRIQTEVHREVYGMDYTAEELGPMQEHAAETAVFYLSLDADLRRDVVERIVKGRKA